MRGQMFLIGAIFFSIALLFMLKHFISLPILDFKANYYLENSAREYNKLLVHCSLYGDCTNKLENFSKFLVSKFPVRVIYLFLQSSKAYLGNFYGASVNVSLFFCNSTRFMSIEPLSVKEVNVGDCRDFKLALLDKSFNFLAKRDRTLFLYLETEAKDKFFVRIY